MTNSEVTAAVISSEAAKGLTIPLTGVLTLSPGSTSFTNIQLRHMDGVAVSIKGWSIVEIVGPVIVSVEAPPGVLVSAVACWTPTNIPDEDKPTTTKHALMYGGAILHASPYLPSPSSALKPVRGLSTSMAGTTTSIMIGNPPQIFARCVASKMSDGDAFTTADSVHLTFSFSAKLEGLDHIRPW